MITSSINGRLRYRASWLKSHSMMAEMEHELKGEAAITSISCNKATGSLLISYDHRAIAKKAFEQKISECAAIVSDKPQVEIKANNKQSSNSDFSGLSVNQSIKFGMLGSLIPSMLWGAFGSKKLHVLSGGVFLLFVFMHMFSYRERLLK